MLRTHFITGTVCAIALSFAATATASISFSQAELLGMTIDLAKSVGYSAGNGTGILTANPTFEDGVTPMAGLAGATGNLLVGGTAYYGLSAADLAAFIASIPAAGDTLDVVGNNDNNQVWDIGIWIETAAGITTDFASLPGFGGSGSLSLALPGAGVLDAGVVVRNGLTQPDDFHGSWGVPEATTIVIWSILGLIGVGRYRQRS